MSSTDPASPRVAATIARGVAGSERCWRAADRRRSVATSWSNSDRIASMRCLPWLVAATLRPAAGSRRADQRCRVVAEIGGDRLVDPAGPLLLLGGGREVL